MCTCKLTQVHTLFRISQHLMGVLHVQFYVFHVVGGLNGSRAGGVPEAAS